MPNKFLDYLTHLGETVGEIPIDHEAILALSDAHYYSDILKANNVQKRFLI